MRKTILVADDEVSLRLLCREVLDKEGYRVIEAQDGIEAIRKIEEETPDLVILDIEMPRMDGMEALPKILRKEKKTPIILYTGHSRYQEEFMAWAADAYVIKSSDFTELKDKVHELLSARGSMEKPGSLDMTDQAFVRTLSAFKHLTALDLWYELGEDDAVNEGMSEAEVEAGLESLRKRGFVEKVRKARLDRDSDLPVYRVTGAHRYMRDSAAQA